VSKRSSTIFLLFPLQALSTVGWLLFLSASGTCCALLFSSRLALLQEIALASPDLRVSAAFPFQDLFCPYFGNSYPFVVKFPTIDRRRSRSLRVEDQLPTSASLILIFDLFRNFLFLPPRADQVFPLRGRIVDSFFDFLFSPSPFFRSARFCPCPCPFFLVF